MSWKKFAAAVLVFGALGFVCSGVAEEPASRSAPTLTPDWEQEESAESTRRVPSKSRYTTPTRSSYRTASRPGKPATLADRIDDFGRKVFGGLFSDDRKQQAHRPAAESRKYLQRTPSGSRSQRAGSIAGRRPTSSAGSAARKTGTSRSTASSARTRQTAEPSSTRNYRPTLSSSPSSSSSVRDYRVAGPRPIWRPSAGKMAQRDDGKTTEPRPLSQGESRDTKKVSKTTSAGLSGLSDPVLRPLHERLQTFRSSAFGNRSGGSPAAKPGSTGDRTATERPQGTVSEGPAAVSRAPLAESFSKSSTQANSAQTAPIRRDTTTLMGPPKSSATAVSERKPNAAPLTRSIISQQTSPPDRADHSVPSGTASPQTTQKKDVLFTRKSPVLGVETIGPRKISVGKESAYEVTIRNTGEVAADEVVVLVNLPAWASVVGADASCGTTNSVPLSTSAVSSNATERFRWHVGRLDAMGRERLVLRIVPRESRPFDLGIRWDYRPEVSQTMIEVQEPRLAMSVEGPREVLYGQKELFKLHISNTGTGDAENVVITLLPMGTGDNRPVSHNLGTLEAGQKKVIEVELTARQVGDLTIKVDVRGDGGVHAELAEKVLVRRPALQVEVLGPKIQFVGAVAAYQIRVTNPGTAPAKNVELSATIPAGAKYVSGVEGARLQANGTKVAWTLDHLDAGAERNFVIRCSLGLPGSSRLDVLSAAEGDLSASAAATTRVEAIADLVLQVNDPAGPVPVGKETIYEIRIRNRGTKNAQDVEIATYFSQGIEPVKVEGGQHRIGPGQVVFSPIASVAAGAEVVLKIVARAGEPGNHVFRVEVHCRPLGAKLASEETTYFYQDGPAPPSAVSHGQQTPPPSASLGPQTLPSASLGPQTLPSASHGHQVPTTSVPLRTTDRRQSVVPPLGGSMQPLPGPPRGKLVPLSPLGPPPSALPPSALTPPRTGPTTAVVPGVPTPARR